MRALPRSLPILAILGSLAHAAPPSETVVRSYWNGDHTAILSDVEVTRADGSRETRQVLGGSVDGIGMVQLELLARTGGTLAFVPTRNTDSKRLRWGGGCIFITPDSAGSKDISAEGETEALAAAMDAWNTATSSCSYMKLMLLPAEPLEVGLDGKNTVKFRESRWCRPAHGDTPEKCYDEGATAITTLFFIDKKGRPDDGQVLDSDIEVNSVDYAMAVNCESRCQTGSTRPIVEDLQNTLTHELGHVLGLDHTCWDGKISESPLDDNNQPAPLCSASNLPASITDATMYNYQDPRETKKRSPEQDDVSGACTNYALASDPKTCEPVDIDTSSGCCAVAGSGHQHRREGAALLGGLLFAVAVAVRIRVRACSRNRRR